LNWLLKHLVAAGRWEARGELKEIRDYEVRLPAGTVSVATGRQDADTHDAKMS
jgi:hypothetical protein